MDPSSQMSASLVAGDSRRWWILLSLGLAAGKGIAVTVLLSPEDITVAQRRHPYGIVTSHKLLRFLLLARWIRWSLQRVCA
jgi:hypothetical protein